MERVERVWKGLAVLDAFCGRYPGTHSVDASGVCAFANPAK